MKQCITQRSKTLMDVSRVILQRQEAFFSHGPNYLKPLRMADIAETLGIHESTVSRAVSKKYLQCSWGVYPMNFFFSRNVGASASERSNNPAKEITAHKIKQFLHAVSYTHLDVYKRQPLIRCIQNTDLCFAFVY